MAAVAIKAGSGSGSEEGVPMTAAAVGAKAEMVGQGVMLWLVAVAMKSCSGSGGEGGSALATAAAFEGEAEVVVEVEGEVEGELEGKWKGKWRGKWRGSAILIAVAIEAEELVEVKGKLS